MDTHIAQSCLTFIKHNDDQASKCAVCTKVFQVKVSDVNPLYGIRDAVGYLSVSDGKSMGGQECDHAKTLWCRDCNVPLCLPCADSDHSNHNLTSYKTILKQQAQILLPEICNYRMICNYRRWLTKSQVAVRRPGLATIAGG